MATFDWSALARVPPASSSSGASLGGKRHVIVADGGYAPLTSPPGNAYAISASHVPTRVVGSSTAQQYWS